MAGFVTARGDWMYERFTLATASAISQGSLVCISNATGREISEYSGGQQGVLGILTHPSANSLPKGKCIVALPRAGCTAYCDVPTGLASSSLSQFDAMGIYKGAQGTTSYITTVYTSAASKIVEIYGPVDSTLSRVEVAFIQNSQQVWSVSTTSIQ